MGTPCGVEGSGVPVHRPARMRRVGGLASFVGGYACERWADGQRARGGGVRAGMAVEAWVQSNVAAAKHPLDLFYCMQGYPLKRAPGQECATGCCHTSAKSQPVMPCATALAYGSCG